MAQSSPVPWPQHPGDGLAVAFSRAGDGSQAATVTLTVDAGATLHAASAGLAELAQQLASWHAAGGALTGTVEVTVTATLPAPEPDEP
jgi:hypothetical protein